MALRDRILAGAIAPLLHRTAMVPVSAFVAASDRPTDRPSTATSRLSGVGSNVVAHDLITVVDNLVAKGRIL